MALRILTLLFALSWSSMSAADIVVIVNAANPIDHLEKKQVIDLFMGRVSAFPNQSPARTFDIQEADPTRALFYKTLTGKSEAQVDAYWATLIFAGRMSPPEKLSSETRVILAVKKNISAIGYVNRQTLPPGVKIVLELPTEQ